MKRFCPMVSLFFFKQKTAYEMRISDWSSDVCSSDLPSSGAVVDSWDYNDSADVSEPGMAVAIDGKFYVVGDDGLYEVVFGAGHYTLVQKADESAWAGFQLSGLAAHTNNPDLLYDRRRGGGGVTLFPTLPRSRKTTA